MKGVNMSDKPQVKPSFWDGIKAEFNKISWPAKTMLVKQSIAVVATSVVVGILIALIDMVVKYGVNLLSM